MPYEKQAVIETVTKLVCAIDQHDFALAKAQFADEVILDYTSLFGGEAEQLSAQTIVDRWSSFLPKLQMTQHTLSNYLVDITGDTATCTCYVQGFHYLPFTEGGSKWLVMGYYFHRLILVNGSWKINYMQLTATYEEGNCGLLAAASNTPIEQRVFFFSEGDQLAGKFYLPSTHRPGQKLPVVIVTGSWTTVKEQMPATYAKLLAQYGFASFIFDFRGYGESQGNPRQYESAAKKVADIQHACDFVASLSWVDASKIAGLAICASAGYMAVAAAEDNRLKAPWAKWHPGCTIMKL